MYGAPNGPFRHAAFQSCYFGMQETVTEYNILIGNPHGRKQLEDWDVEDGWIVLTLSIYSRKQLPCLYFHINTPSSIICIRNLAPYKKKNE
jgi:hypothetical protein